LLAASVRAQDNPLDDPDLQQLLKQAQEMQKNARDGQKNPGSLDTRKKLADMEAMAKQEAARQEQEEKDEKEKLQAELKKPERPLRYKHCHNVILSEAKNLGST
jgi:hypothetical protein